MLAILSSDWSWAHAGRLHVFADPGNLICTCKYHGKNSLLRDNWSLHWPLEEMKNVMPCLSERVLLLSYRCCYRKQALSRISSKPLPPSRPTHPSRGPALVWRLCLQVFGKALDSMRCRSSSLGSATRLVKSWAATCTKKKAPAASWLATTGLVRSASRHIDCFLI